MSNIYCNKILEMDNDNASQSSPERKNLKTQDMVKYRKEYYAQNRDKLKEYQIEYRKNNKQYYDTYREEKKEELKDKYRIQCPHCNKMFNKYYLPRHINNKHNNN